MMQLLKREMFYGQVSSLLECDSLSFRGRQIGTSFDRGY